MPIVVYIFTLQRHVIIRSEWLHSGIQHVTTGKAYAQVYILKELKTSYFLL
jgi:hypothetical protein